MSEGAVWITGAGGLIGHYLAQTAPRFAPGWRVKPLTRATLDLTDFGAVEQTFTADEPKLVVHCAALSRSPDCQRDPALARLLNVEVTALLAHLAAGIPFVFFSTDLVFDGRKGNYTEEDSVSPLSIYAETKAEAERLVLANSRHTIIRTSLNAGSSPTGDRGFNEQMRRALEGGETLNLFTDEFRSPIPAAVTAQAVWELARMNKPGLYHLAGAERLSRWEMGRLLAERWPGAAARMRAGSLREYHGAPRAPDTSLNCDKVQRLLSFPLPRFSGWIRENSGESL